MKKPEPMACNPAADPRLRKFYEDASECMLSTGRALLSLTELRAWMAQGRPARPTEHLYVNGTCLLCSGAQSEISVYEDAWCPLGRQASA